MEDKLSFLFDIRVARPWAPVDGEVPPRKREDIDGPLERSAKMRMAEVQRPKKLSGRTGECHSRTRNTTQERGPDMVSQYKEMGDGMTQTVLMMDVMYVQFLLKI